jgi:hypothetical protein
MKKVWSGLVVLAVTGLTAHPALAQRGRGVSPQEVARNGWLSDYRQAKDVASKTGKPILLVFRCVP